jgi:hypothetical protein
MVQLAPQQYGPTQQSWISRVFTIAVGVCLGLFMFCVLSFIASFIIFGAVLGSALTGFEHQMNSTTSTTETTTVEPTP